MTKAEVQGDRIIIWDRNEGTKIFESGWFGDLFNDRLELALAPNWPEHR